MQLHMRATHARADYLPRGCSSLSVKLEVDALGVISMYRG